MMTNEDKQTLRVLANRDITRVLDKLGVAYNGRGNLIQGTCPCKQHGGDGNNKTAFSWRQDIGYWMCWTHHCETKFGNDIFGLVRSILQCDFNAALDWIEKVLGNQSVGVIPTPRILKPKGDLRVHAPLDETRLRFLKQRPQYLLDRGYSPEVLDKYQIGLWDRIGSYMHERAVFPVRDHQGFLVGFTSRTIHDETWFTERSLDYKKWLHGRYFDRPPRDDDSLWTGSVLFNLFNSKTFLMPHRRMILVEGPLDGLKLQMYGIYNWVASLSTTFTAGHRSLLVQQGVSDLYVAYDADDPTKYEDGIGPGDKGWTRMQRIVGDLFRLHRVNLPIGKDPGSLDEKSIRDIFLPISQAQC